MEVYYEIGFPAALRGAPVAMEEQREAAFSDEARKAMRIAVIMAIFAAACVILSAAFLLSSRQETGAVAELTRSVNRLRAEVAVRDARYQASKGVMESAGRLHDLRAIQSIVDAYALEETRNGAMAQKTAEDVRREVCDRLSVAGYPCVL